MLQISPSLDHNLNSKFIQNLRDKHYWKKLVVTNIWIFVIAVIEYYTHYQNNLNDVFFKNMHP